MTALVSTYCWSNKDHLHFTQALLRAACLLSLGELGQGAIHCANEAARSLGIPLVQLLSYMGFADLKPTILRIVSFVDQMAEKPTNTEVTWPWARLFEDGALSQLSVQNNISFCLTCLFLVTGGSDQEELCKIAQFSKAMESRVRKERAKEPRKVADKIRDRKRAQTTRRLRAEEPSDDNRSEDSDSGEEFN
ncbi:Rhabdovirus nucleoprotein [Popillia japonica]|uniref:Rhabdovirus nucleoprotein n=1 Tax=Popillia japonica TaxID=7064 RepID=A0AAW1JCR6_POPJA